MISVIIPVYNVEEYLSECLDSVLSQTYKNLEIIIVNDGSPDNSQKIINEYKKKDKRIISLIKENGGISSARNYGMKRAKGDYLFFLDSDDYISDDFLENLISISESGCLTVHNYYFKPGKYKVDEFTREYLYGSFFNGCTRFLFDKNSTTHLFDESAILMEDSRFLMDELFNYLYVKTVNKGFYYYRKNPNSLTRKKNEVFTLSKNYLDSLDYMENVCKENQFYFDKKKFYHRKIVIIYGNIHKETNLKDLKNSLNKLKELKLDYKDFKFLDKIKLLIIKNKYLNNFIYLRQIIKKIIRGVK